MLDDKTQETLRRLLDLAEHPATPATERSLALARIRAMVLSPKVDGRPVNGIEAQILQKIRPLTRWVDEELVSEVHGDLYTLSARHMVIREAAEEMAELLTRWTSVAPQKRHRYGDAVRAAASRLVYLLERGDLLRTQSWRNRRAAK
ncbi:hypothetical protein [Rhizohabitans arisaemae]|uniref:hypothetical protein n=1 Tax=Rhizohabitans arisaemae TaxID=2720610 RepID=UPI0024B25A04|nr:hypothetical protein [Rhizohabitans arisaemae]